MTRFISRTFVEGVAQVLRTTTPTPCACCPEDAHHVLARQFVHPETKAVLDPAELLAKLLDQPGVEGQRIRITVEVLPPRTGPFA